MRAERWCRSDHERARHQSRYCKQCLPSCCDDVTAGPAEPAEEGEVTAIEGSEQATTPTMEKQTCNNLHHGENKQSNVMLFIPVVKQ